MKGMRVEDQVLSIEDGDTRDARMRGIISITFMPVMNLPSPPDINNCPKEKDVYGKKKKKRNKEEKREQKRKIGKREKRKREKRNREKRNREKRAGEKEKKRG